MHDHVDQVVDPVIDQRKCIVGLPLPIEPHRGLAIGVRSTQVIGVEETGDVFAAQGGG